MTFEWAPIRREDAANTHLSVQIIERVFEYQEQLRDLVHMHLDRNVFLVEYDLTGDIRTIPFRELFNAIETNLNHLVATNFVPGMEFTKIWRGGLADDQFLDYTDVNRWFETMYLLFRYIQSRQPRYLEANAFHLGMNPDHQIASIT